LIVETPSSRQGHSSVVLPQKTYVLNPKHESRGPAERNPKQGSKSEIQMFKTNSEALILLNSLTTWTIGTTDMEIAILLPVKEVFSIRKWARISSADCFEF
jgi:hypothetical protein